MRRLEEEGSYFSLGEMADRCPMLFEEVKCASVHTRADTHTHTHTHTHTRTHTHTHTRARARALLK
jgi:hypothetical protein